MYWSIVINAYGLNEYLSPNAQIGIANFVLFSMILSFIGTPKWLSQNKKHTKFIKISQNNQNVQVSWSSYICIDRNNFIRFQVHLIHLEIFQNLLFWIELNQYKQAVSRKVDRFQRGFALELDDDVIQNVSGINEGSLVQHIKDLDIDQITSEQIKNDMDHLFSKYLENSDNAVFVTFVSSSDRIIIEQKMKRLQELEVLTIFDDILRKTNNTMQLLYEEYVTSS